MNKKRAIFLAAAAAAVVLLAGVYVWGPSSAPRGQPALVTLSRANLGEFEKAFDDGSDAPRLVLLLSPT